MDSTWLPAETVNLAVHQKDQEDYSSSPNKKGQHQSKNNFSIRKRCCSILQNTIEHNYQDFKLLCSHMHVGMHPKSSYKQENNHDTTGI